MYLPVILLTQVCWPLNSAARQKRLNKLINQCIEADREKFEDNPFTCLDISVR